MDSTEMRKAAIIMARAAELNATVGGMVAENKQREIQGESPSYVMDDFRRQIELSGCHHNAICEVLEGY